MEKTPSIESMFGQKSWSFSFRYTEQLDLTLPYILPMIAHCFFLTLNHMHIQQTGKITDDFYVVGNAHVPVYLLDGPKPVLFDAGFTALSNSYEQDIKKILKKRAPAYLFLTHSHFDHIGAASHFIALWPKQPEAAYLLNTHARVERVWERMQSSWEAAKAVQK